MTIQTECRKQFEYWYDQCGNGSSFYTSIAAWNAAWQAHASQVAAPPAQVQESECKVCYGKGWFPNQKWIAGNGKPPTLYCWKCAAPPEPAATIQDCLTVDKDSLTAAAQPVSQEPVAWIDEFGNVFPLSAWKNHDRASHFDIYKKPWKPLYLATPQPATEQAELSDDELLRMFYDDHAPWYFGDVDDDVVLGYARAVLAAAKGEQQ